MEKGNIYRDVAKKAIINWYLWSQPADIAENIAEEIIRIIPLELIEKGAPTLKQLGTKYDIPDLANLEYGIGALNSIEAGLRSIANSTNATKILEMSSEQLRDALLSNSKDLEVILKDAMQSALSDAKFMCNELQSRNINTKGLLPEDLQKLFKQVISIDALEAVHDKWVIDNEKKFSKADRYAKQYMHLPVELIGWKDVDLDLLFVDPVLKAAEINVDKKDLKNEYEFRYETYDRTIKEKGILEFLLSYEPLKNQPNVIAKMQDGPTLSHLTDLSTEKSLDPAEVRPRLLTKDAEMQMSIDKLSKAIATMSKILEITPDDEFIEMQVSMMKQELENRKEEMQTIINTAAKLALLNAEKLSSGDTTYLRRMADQRIDGPTNAGSAYEIESSEKLIDLLWNADWTKTTDNDVLNSLLDGCVAYECNLPGKQQIIDIDTLPDDTVFYAIDPKGTGTIGIGAANVPKQNINKTYMIVGTEEINGKECPMAFTFHPGKPVSPSELSMEDAKSILGKSEMQYGIILSKEEVKKLGFSMVKFMSPEMIKDYEIMQKLMDGAKLSKDGKTLEINKRITQEDLDIITYHYKQLETLIINGKEISIKPKESKIIGAPNIDNEIAGKTAESRIEFQNELINKNLMNQNIR